MSQPSGKRYGMVIDLSRCVGCWTCAVACKSESDQALGTWWNRILTSGAENVDSAVGEYPSLSHGFLPISCQHCDNAPCVKVCPVGATYKRKSDGVVLVDFDRCIGCRYCMAACPYGVRVFNWGDPVRVPSGFPLGNQSVHYDPDPTSGPNRLVYTPERPKGVVEKCTLCVQRIDEGLVPICVEVCPSRARIFGDLHDPNSDVSQMISKSGAVKLLPDLGTEPGVFYIPARTTYDSSIQRNGDYSFNTDSSQPVPQEKNKGGN
jgi:molybdopterin-containing oxidoreductase family iron-sulfur binding subunit